MRDAHRTVLARSAYLWIAAGLLFGFTILAATTASARLIELVLVLNGGFAVVGIAFGIWTGRTLARAVRCGRIDEAGSSSPSCRT